TCNASAERARKRHHFDARYPSQDGDGAADSSQGAQGERLHVVHVVVAGERPTSIPEPIVSSTSDPKASTANLTNDVSGDHALTARQNHRIRKRSASRHHPAHSYYPGGPSEDRTSALGYKWTFP